MTIISLYKYARPDGGVDVSPIQPVGIEYTQMYRLIADDGMVLSNGETTVCCVDTETPEEWYEELDDSEED